MGGSENQNNNGEVVEVELSDEHLGRPLHEGDVFEHSDTLHDGDLRPYPSKLNGRRTAYVIAAVVAAVLVVVGIAVLASGGGGGGDDGSSGAGSGGTGGGDEPWVTSVRLPEGVVPEHYDISIHPDLTDFKFDGNVTATFRATKAQRQVIFHAASPLVVDTATLAKAGGAGAGAVVPTKPGFAYEEHQFYVLPLEDELPAGQYELRVTFHGNLTDALAGLYRSHYVDSNGTDHYIATTQFEPTDARRAFPCFDEPQLKANFTVALVRPGGSEWTALSNMPEIASEPYGGGGGGPVLVHFDTSPRMSTYLVCLVVCDFDKRNDTTKTGVPVAVWAPRDEIDQVELALQVARDVLPHYDEFYNFSYPLPKLDMIAIPDFAAGAMENWGLVTYRQVDLLYDPATSSAAARQRVAVVVAHELGHQHNGDLVTLEWWNALWLNEGFATWMEHYGVDKVFPDWGMWDQFAADTMRSALSRDSLHSSHPIDVEVNDPDEINEIFDAISYSKGGSVIRMMRAFMGNARFQEAMRDYMRTHAYGNALSGDLWDAMTRHAPDGLDVRHVMERWVKQSGYPLVSIAADGTVTQSQFSLDGNQTGAGVWDVPLTFGSAASGAAAAPAVSWFGPDAGGTGARVEMPAGVPRGNVGQWGYYRVTYDAATWDRVVDEMGRGDASDFAPLDRVGTLDDAFNLARAGLLPYDKALRATLGLANDTDRGVWRVAASHFGFLRKRLELHASFGELQAHVRRVLAPALADPALTSWNDTDLPGGKEEHLARLRRSTLLAEAAAFGHPGTLAKVRDLYAVFMRNSTEFAEAVGPDLRLLVWSYGVQQGGEGEWDRLWAYRQEAARTVIEKRDILRALAFTRVPWLLSRYLEWSLDPDRVRLQDNRYPMVGVASNPVGAQVAWRFVRENWDRLDGAGIGGGSIVQRVLANSDDLSLIPEVEAFVEEHDAQSAARAVEQAAEEIRANARWNDEHLEAVLDTLRELNQQG